MFCTLLIPLVQSGDQLIIVRLLTGFGGGFAVSSPFPIAAELMPAQHRRTFSAVLEMSLAMAFTVLPIIGALVADNPDSFRLMALPGGLRYLSFRRCSISHAGKSALAFLRHGRAEAAVISGIRRSGRARAELTREPRRAGMTTREDLPPYSALFRHGSCAGR